MDIDKANSTPDGISINGANFTYERGIGFSFIGDNNLIYTYRTHLFIFNAIKTILGKNSFSYKFKPTDDIFKYIDDADKILDDFDCERKKPLSKDDIESWVKLGKETNNSMNFYRKASKSGRIWKNLTVPNIDGNCDIVSFWTNQKSITNKELNILKETFKLTSKYFLWIAMDSTKYNEYNSGETSTEKKLKSGIAPHLTHDELISILMRAHYDANLSPFERRIARELQGLDPTVLKAHTGGYPTTAEYNYRSRFSESFSPLLNENSVFDGVVEKYITSFNK
jgi:hypothetical protein